ncbi:hypothetical protein [Pseudothioclava arenosa]|nr:hypothetical protein [Pseudothioclava arenosa]
MTRIAFTLAALTLAACQMEAMGPDGAPLPRIDRVGTCFLYVTDEGNSRFSVTSGVGDGSKEPLALVKRGLSAAEADALWAKERRIMDLNPECLAIRATDRAQALPAPKA